MFSPNALPGTYRERDIGFTCELERNGKCQTVLEGLTGALNACSTPV